MKILESIAWISFTAASLCSCSSPALKAPPAEISSFLASTPALKPDPKISPFALSGGSPATTQRSIYIAPVTLRYLRDASKPLAKGAICDVNRPQAARDLAEYAQRQFTAAFKKSPHVHYLVQSSPSHDCIKLELAITELNRNTFPGAFARFALNTIAVPGTDVILAKTTRGLKGNIAIEGKVTDVSTGKVIYQFADNEESKSAVVVPITDWAAYGQARDAIHDWAKEFEEVTRAAPGQPVKGSSVMSFF